VSEKSLPIRHFQAFAHLEKAGAASAWAGGVARHGKNETNGSDGTGWVYNTSSSEAKKEILEERARQFRFARILAERRFSRRLDCPEYR